MRSYNRYNASSLKLKNKHKSFIRIGMGVMFQHLRKLGIGVLLVGLSACGGESNQSSSSDIESVADLGERLFNDVNLSLNRTQSCATCHNAAQAFVDTRANAVNQAVSVGDDGVALGDRNAPTLTYANLIPAFSKNADGEYVGGQFHDGRAATLADQAGGPPLNPVEMMMPDKASVVARIKENTLYLEAFERFFGASVFSDDDTAYAKMAESIARFENSNRFATFDSKYDRSLLDDDDPNYYEMTFLETAGMGIFFSNNNINCITCHQLKTTYEKEEPFTNYLYHNIGVPINWTVRNANGQSESDPGLLGNANVDEADTAQAGKFKVPTLRNISVTGPYMHNGVFQNLCTVLMFYDHMRVQNNPDRTLNPETNLAWGDTEYPETINHADLGMNSPLTDTNIRALLAFLNTLTDARYEHLIPQDQLSACGLDTDE